MTETWVPTALVFVSFGATVVVSVALLWLFFDLRAHLRHRRLGQDQCFRTLPGIDRRSLMQVRLKDGQVFADVRLVGVMDADAARNAGLPHPLTNLVAFERDDGSRLWVDAAAIRVLETVRARGSE